MKKLSTEALDQVKLDWKRNEGHPMAARAQRVADLNGLLPEQVLELMGEPVPKKGRKKPTKVSDEVKEEAVANVLEKGMSRQAAAKIAGVSGQAVGSWVAEAQKDEEAELAELGIQPEPEAPPAPEPVPEPEPKPVTPPIPEAPALDPLVAMLESRLAELIEAGKMLDVGMTRLVQLGACPTEELHGLKEQKARLAAFAEGFEAALSVVYAARREDP